MPIRGFLLTFEGMDASGKFTQSEKTRDWLESLGYNVAVAKEPNDQSSPMGIRIREMLRGEAERPSDAFEFQRLYVIDRAQNFFVWYLKFLERGLGNVDIIERYALTTLAYGMLSGHPPEDFIRLHEEVIGPRMIWPDLTILLDIPAEEAVCRIANGRDHVEFFEKEKTLVQVRKNYLQARNIGPFAGRVVVVDGMPAADEVFQSVKAAILPLLPKLSA